MSVNYKKNIDQLKSEHNVDEKKGLTNIQVELLRKKYGFNAFDKQKKESFVRKLLHHAKDITTFILLVAAAVSTYLAITTPEGDYIEGIVIISIVIINAFLGATQEQNAEKALESLQEMNKQKCRVIRNEQTIMISSEELVPGDILVIETGDVIAADGRLITSTDLQIDESPLTGESVPVEKDAKLDLNNDKNLGDRLNMAFSGCLVTGGRGLMLVTETGMYTEMGKIATLLNNEKSGKTPLQIRLNKLAKRISYLALSAAAIVFVIGFVQGEELNEMFMTAVSLAVAAVPETLMVIVTLTLSVSVKKMVEKHAVIRKLPAVETLGSASVICSDKTGTLTQNKMTVQEIWTSGFNVVDAEHNMTDAAMNVVKFAGLSSNAKMQILDNKKNIIGNPTEKAIIELLDDNGLTIEEYEKRTPRIHEIPFSSTRKMMTTVHKSGDHYVSITKGAFDRIKPLTVEGNVIQAEQINSRFGKKGMRVIAVAFKYYRELPSDLNEKELEKDLHLLGLLGIVDPPRPESKDAITKAKRAGVRTVMITGDHSVTASAIASELGILTPETKVITGNELSLLSDEELYQNVEDYSVYARVSPEDKIRIVKAWQANGNVVAMTGDGVNDAPALKASDVGCAMGITGTDVAKGASDIVLTDDNFSTIVDAIEEGRTSFTNIKKAINFLLTANISEILIVTLAMALGWGVPVMAIHLLLINVIADGLPGFAFSVEKPEKDVMTQKPISNSAGIFSGGLGKILGLNAIMFTIITLIGYYIGQFVNVSSSIEASYEVAQTMAFLILGYSSVVHAFNCRSKESIFKIKFTSNKRMFEMVLLSLAILTIIALLPGLQSALHLVPLAKEHWQIVIILAILPLVITEIVKIHFSKDGE